MCGGLYLSQGLPEHSILPRVWPVRDNDPAILPFFSDCFDLKVVYLRGSWSCPVTSLSTAHKRAGLSASRGSEPVSLDLNFWVGFLFASFVCLYCVKSLNLLVVRIATKPWLRLQTEEIDHAICTSNFLFYKIAVSCSTKEQYCEFYDSFRLLFQYNSATCLRCPDTLWGSSKYASATNRRRKELCKTILNI